MVASQLIIEIDERIAVRDGKEYTVKTSNIGSKPAELQTWQEYYFSKDRGQARAVFMQLASTPSVWFAAGEDAELVALALSQSSLVETTYLEDQGHAMLKLAPMDETRLSWLEQWLDGPVESYLEGDKELIVAAMSLNPVAVPQPDFKDYRQFASTEQPKPAAKLKPAQTWLDAWEQREKEVNDAFWDAPLNEAGVSVFPNKLIFIKTGQTGNVSLVVGEDAQIVGKILKLTPQYLKEEERWLHAIKFQLAEDYPPQWFKVLRGILNSQEMDVEFLDLHKSHPDVNAFANRFKGSLPVVPMAHPDQRIFKQQTPEQAAAANTLVEHPLAGEQSNVPESNNNLPADQSVTDFLADPTREELLHRKLEQSQQARVRLSEENDRLSIQLEELRQELGELKLAQNGARPAPQEIPPTDDDPLREKLLRCRWHLDYAMASLSSNYDLEQTDAAILRYFSNQTPQTAMLLFRTIENILHEDTLDAVREYAHGTNDEARAVADAMTRLSKDEHLAAHRRNGR